MRFDDLIIMCVGNLWRRKLRTLLTVLGVLIGTASVVVMVSLGLGLDSMNTEMYSRFGSLTAVTVRAPYNDPSSKIEPTYLTDDVIKQLKNMDHVESVCPLLSTNVIFRSGIYTANVNLIGATPEYLAQIELDHGAAPEKGELSLILGNMIPVQFSNNRTGANYWSTGELPDVDLTKNIFTIFETDKYYQSQSSSSDKPVQPPKKYNLKIAGMTKGGPEDWSEYSYDVYTDLDALIAQLKKIYRKDPIPGQPTTKKGKPLKHICYERIVVYCDDMNNVTAVQNSIQNMGFQASSNMEWLEQSRQQSRIIQLVLGGIGAVALLVAAIGIANTMMMSIYERTREIGIIKVLGCDMNRIRDMFLIESGCIGFLGGVVGLLLSYAGSFVLNRVGAASMLMGMEGNISRIPFWLAVGAVAFAVLVGMLAGFFPSLRAMKLSPLTALRNE